MQNKLDNLNFQLGDYVRVYLPNRQRAVPCKIIGYSERGFFMVQPLTKRQQNNRWEIMKLQILNRIDPKEINLP